MLMSDTLTERSALTALERAADLWGIEREFWDIWGERHSTPPEAQAAVLKSLGVNVSTERDIERAIAERQRRAWARLLPYTTVLGESAPFEIAVRLPAELQNETAILEVRFENGMSARADLDLSAVPVSDSAQADGRRFVEKKVLLPGERSLGYHTVTLRLKQREACDARVIVCPDRAYQPEWMKTKSAAGISVSLYSLRSRRNWGCGDFTDLKQFIDWATHSVSISFVGLNPLHSIPNRQPFNTSPYLPNCSYYRNPIYLDVENIEDFARSPWARRLLASDTVRREIAALRDSELVEYERVHRLKHCFLKLIFRQFLLEFPHETPRTREFRAYIEKEGDLLHRFAVHAALDETMHRRDPNAWNWNAWPEQYRRPDSPATREFAQSHWRSVLFHKYVQWQIDLQLCAAQKHARKRGLRLGIYHDLALATDRFGCDLWANRDFYVSGCRVGSPPDNFAPKGQDWAFPPPNSERHYRDGYHLFAESIRKGCQHGGALRIDHVMRFFRLFWIPDGMDATQGTYVRERFAELLHVLALESVRNSVVLVGEDLGTVPDFIRDTLAEFGILSYRLFYFEQDKSARFKRPNEYPRQALVSATTHDLPTLAGFWTNRDIEARRAAGMLPDEASYRHALEERSRDKQKILDLFHELRLVPDWTPREAWRITELTGDLHNAAVGFLASTPCSMMILNQEDLFKETEQQNLPGTTAEYPNWRRKMRFHVEDLAANGFTRDCAAMFRNWVERTGRASHVK